MFQDFIRERELLTPAQYKDIIEKVMSGRNVTFYSVLMDSGYAEQSEIVTLACEYYGYDYIEDPFHTPLADEANLKLGDVSTMMATRQFAVVNEGALTYILADPEDEATKNRVQTLLEQTPRWSILTARGFEIFSEYRLTPMLHAERAKAIRGGGSVRVTGLSERTSVTQQLINGLCEGALDLRASDLHLVQVDENTATVSLRVDGRMHPYATIQASALENMRIVLKNRANIGGEAPDQPISGQIVTEYRGEHVDTRINIVKSKAGYSFNMRFIDRNLRALEEIGLSKRNLEAFARLLKMTKGLVILCGPTGSGKTSLLYAAMQKLSQENKSLFTLEDPPESAIPGVTQVDIKSEKGQTYEAMFPNVLRQDPDAIIIGEIRSPDVAMDCIRAANTGHLVFSTLHTTDAVGVISRLVNMGVEAYALGDVLVSVVAQRLVRRVCPSCKQEYDLPDDHYWRDMFHLPPGPVRLARGCGCAECGGTGYRGRIAINEILITNPQIRDAIQNRQSRTVIEKYLLEAGFRSYLDDGIEKALAGITSFEELESIAADII